MTTPANLPAVESEAAYPVPNHLTPGGLTTFRSEVARFAAGVGTELERQAITTLSMGGQPEHTAEAVERARRAYLEGLQNFLNSAWQVGLFGAFIMVGLVGLGLTLTGGSVRSGTVGDA